MKYYTLYLFRKIKNQYLITVIIILWCKTYKYIFLILYFNFGLRGEDETQNIEWKILGILFVRPIDWHHDDYNDEFAEWNSERC